MNRIITLTKKELSTYFYSPVAYILITFFLVLSSWLFFRTFFLYKQSTLRPFFEMLPWVLLFFVPAVSMRTWAEEKKMGTIEILLTWPIKDYEAVLGKFLGSFLFLCIAIAGSISLPIVLAIIGTPDWGVIFSQYLGAIFLASAYLAVGLFASSLSDNQIVAFIIAVSLSFLFFIIGQNFVLFLLPSFIAKIFASLSISSHFLSISRGVIDSKDIIYYISFIAFFLLLGARNIAKRF